MWKTIERFKQGEYVNVQDLETNLYWEFGKFTSRDGESLESYYLRFVALVKQSQELKTVSYHKLYDILKQHQNEVNEIRAERLAPANKNKGKAIVNTHPPTYDQEPAMVAEDDEMSKEKNIDKLMALISLSFKKIYKPTNNNLGTSSNTSRANQDSSSRTNRGTGYDNQRAVNVVRARETVARKCQKPKRAKDAAYHKENMLLYKQEEDGIRLSAEQIQEVTLDVADNSGPIFDVEVQNDDDNYNVFANDKEHPEQPGSVNVTYLNEHNDTNITTDSLDMSNNGGRADQDEDEDLARERDLLAFLIKKLKCEIDENKDLTKLLESSNKTLVDKLKTELDRYHDVNYASKVEINCAKAKEDLMSYKMKSQKSFNEYTRKINDLNQTISKMKKELIAHQDTISIMSQEKEAQKKFHKTHEDKELEKVIALEKTREDKDN
ncbi:hypothetical protein Tco_0792405 [Tanacetum coccineum]